MAKTQIEELRDELRKHYAEAGGGWVRIKGMLKRAEQLVRQEQMDSTPDDWHVVGGNRIAIFKPDGEVVRLAEFYNMFWTSNLPGEANAELAVRAVNTMRRVSTLIGDGAKPVILEGQTAGRPVADR